MTALGARSMKLGVAGAVEAAQYLTFVLGGEDYGIDILRVQEIKGYTQVTPLPNTPAHIKGMMNLRGTVVPVVDLRVRFGMAETQYTRFTVIIVVSVGTRVVGLVVDAVSDVLAIARADIQPPPDLGAGVDLSYVAGLARAGEKLVTLLAIDRVVGADELGALT